MKKNNKGFTLIELLAIISILAIILLIAVPAISNVIENARKNAFKNTAYSVFKAAEFSYDLKKLNDNVFDEITIDLSNKNDPNIGLIKLKGEYPSGTVTIKTNGEIIFNINNGKYCATSTGTSDSITVSNDCENAPVVLLTENAPVLTTGMTPIKWDESGNVVTTTITDPEWYDYSSNEKKWANAQTEDGSMWVWIPRYAYKIPEANFHTSTAGVIEIKFLNGTTDTAYDGASSKAVNQGQNCLNGSNVCSKSEFVTHPAFDFGGTQLQGIWVMKFEASNTTQKPQSLPNVISLIRLTNNEIFTVARSMETNSAYGWGTSGSGIDTHMMKDVEWGAVVYLATSMYGKTDEIWINNSYNNTTGCAGSSISAAPGFGCENTYNSMLGVNASTTGNVYGIYDMSGGAAERTAAYVNNGGTNLTLYGSSLVNADSKYKDVYMEGSSDTQVNNYNANVGYYGNAIYETSYADNDWTSWNIDNSDFVYTNNPFLGRGGANGHASGSGGFNFDGTNGGAHTIYGFRSTLLIQNGL